MMGFSFHGVTLVANLLPATVDIDEKWRACMEIERWA